MWKVLNEFVRHYKTRLGIPFVVSVPRREIQIPPQSIKSKLKLQLSFFLLLAHTIYCFLALAWWWTRKASTQDNELRVVRTFVILREFNVSAAALPMHFVISFRAHVGLGILNPITRFQKRVASEMLYLLFD